MSITAILLIAIGLVLILIEIFLLPGFGVAGIPGIALMIAGVGFAWYRLGITTGLIYAGITVAVTIPISLIALWLVPRTRIGRTMILETSENSLEGYSSSSSELEELVDKSGMALTTLRPAGAAIIDDKRVDVVTAGDFIEKGSEIKVVRVEGNKVVVSKMANG